jgi:outer membrane protein, adhesin transport system
MYKYSLLMVALICSFCVGTSVRALSLKDAIIYVLETNPEITAAEANKQAIEFELEQAQSFRAPRFELEAWAGSSLNDGNTTPDLTSADSAISGYELSGRISQMLFDGYETRSEIERQAYRIDSAAFRVLERSETLSLEAVRTFSDVVRSQTLLGLAHKNLSYHREVHTRMQHGYDKGVIGIGDLEQANERTIQAEDIVIDFELNFQDSKTLFLAIVGVDALNLSTIPSIASSVPSNLEKSIAAARQRNPTIMFLQADVGASEALARRVASNKYPSLSLEADVRGGEDVRGYEGSVADARIGLVMRYTFQGSSNRAIRQEHIRRVSESRSRLLSQSRQIESEVRQSWSTLRAAQRRTKTIRAQSELSRKLRGIYEKNSKSDRDRFWMS